MSNLLFTEEELMQAEKAKTSAIRAIGREIAFWANRGKYNVSRTFTVSYTDNPFLGDVFASSAPCATDKEGNKKLTRRNGFNWGTITLKEDGGTVNLAPDAWANVKEGLWDDCVLEIKTPNEAILVSEGAIKSTGTTNFWDLVDYETALFPENDSDDELQSARDVSFIYSSYPYIFTCEETKYSSCCLKYLKCTDKATIYVHFMESGQVTSVPLVDKGRPTVSCASWQLANLLQNKSYTAHDGNAKERRSDKEIINYAADALMQIGVVTKGNPVSLDKIPEVCYKYLATIEANIQAAINRNFEGIMQDTASIMKYKEEGHYKTLAEAFDAFNDRSGESLQLLSLPEDGGAVFQFVDHSLIDITNCANIFHNDHAWCGPNIKMPYMTNNYHINQIQFFVVLKYLTRERIDTMLLLNTEAIMGENYLEDSTLNLPF